MKTPTTESRRATAEEMYMREQKKHPMEFGAYTLPEQWQLKAMKEYAQSVAQRALNDAAERARIIQSLDPDNPFVTYDRVDPESITSTTIITD